MIIKGESVGGAGRLAVHLMRTDTNESVRLGEFRDLAAEDLRGALLEMEALGAGTRTTKPLYHASINTLAVERLTDEQRAQAIEELGKKLGFEGQPYVVVIHDKKDREHCHVVWSRIDLEHMRAIPDSHNFAKHEEIARRLEREFGLTRVQGAHVERDGQPRPKRTPSHAEMLQAERTGLTPQQVTEQVTALWRTTDNGKSFAAALSDAGYVLARGDRRDFVIIDPKCGTHSLARRIEGARVKDVRERMVDIDPLQLPGVAEAKAIQRERQAERSAGIAQEVRPDGARGIGGKAPDADRGKSHGTHEKSGAEARALDGMTRGVGAIFDGIASIFERGLSGDGSEAEQEPLSQEARPAEPEVEPSVRTDEEERSKRRQELLREFGRELEDERDAPFERERRRSR